MNSKGKYPAYLTGRLTGRQANIQDSYFFTGVTSTMQNSCSKVKDF